MDNDNRGRRESLSVVRKKEFFEKDNMAATIRRQTLKLTILLSRALRKTEEQVDDTSLNAIVLVEEQLTQNRVIPGMNANERKYVQDHDPLYISQLLAGYALGLLHDWGYRTETEANQESNSSVKAKILNRMKGRVSNKKVESLTHALRTARLPQPEQNSPLRLLKEVQKSFDIQEDEQV